jgi:hypothetical protein
VSKEEAPRILSLAGHDVAVTHPSKPYFSKLAKLSKLAIVEYYVAVSEGALAAIRDRPIVLKRFVNGAESEPFYQKRAPEKTMLLASPGSSTSGVSSSIPTPSGAAISIILTSFEWISIPVPAFPGRTCDSSPWR